MISINSNVGLNENITYYLITALIVVILITTLIVARRALRRVIKILVRRGPRRGRFRLFRRGRVFKGAQRTGARARNVIGTSGFAFIERLFHPPTATDKAIVESDLKASATEDAVDTALIEYESRRAKFIAEFEKSRAQDFSIESGPNIDLVIDIFVQTEEENWHRKREDILTPHRIDFFEKHRKKIENLNRKKGITFDTINFDGLDYDSIGEYIDEDNIFENEALKRHIDMIDIDGLIFKKMRQKPGYIRLIEDIDPHKSRRNYLLATHFLAQNIETHPDEDLLFEDINDAFIVNSMGIEDRDVYYFLNRSRKIVNANVRLLSTLLSGIISFYIFSYYWIAGLPLVEYMGHISNFWNTHISLSPGNGFFNIGSAFDPILFYAKQLLNLISPRITTQQYISLFLQKSVFAIIGYFAAMLAMTYFYRNPYNNCQNQNRANLTALMSSYSGSLKALFSKAESNTRGSFTGDTGGPLAKEDGKIWFINMQWIGFRLYFVELFIRSIVFQIKRNSGYYILGMPLAIIGFSVIFFCVIPDLIINGLPNFISFEFMRHMLEILLLNAVFLWLIYRLSIRVGWENMLTKCMEGFLSLSGKDWTNFRNIGFQRDTAGLIRHMIAELFQERNRAKR